MHGIINLQQYTTHQGQNSLNEEEPECEVAQTVEVYLYTSTTQHIIYRLYFRTVVARFETDRAVRY